MDSKKLLKRLALLILFIFLANFLANTFYWYSSIWYFDIIMHFLGGVWVGLLVLYFLMPKDFSRESILKVLGGVLLVGIGWEIFEAGVNTVISENPFNARDTFSDIFFDTAGGCAALFYYLRKYIPKNFNNNTR